jgi:hypothetical protein
VSETELQELFAAWWKESFPMAPANKQAAASHVAFATHALELQNVLTEYEAFDR